MASAFQMGDCPKHAQATKALQYIRQDFVISP